MPVIPPVNPLSSCQLHLLERAPGASLADHLGPVRRGPFRGNLRAARGLPGRGWQCRCCRQSQVAPAVILSGGRVVPFRLRRGRVSDVSGIGRRARVVTASWVWHQRPGLEGCWRVVHDPRVIAGHSCVGGVLRAAEVDLASECLIELAELFVLGCDLRPSGSLLCQALAQRSYDHLLDTSEARSAGACAGQGWARLRVSIRCRNACRL